jgi:predicted transposase/invertase (TIGR01784 family)
MTISAEKYINPFTDFGFKKLFGTEVNKDLLMDFLNELIRCQGKIKEVKYLNSEQLGRSEDDRRAVFDIYCETETGETFIVEMQKAKLNFFKDRSVYYASFPIREQGLRGDWDYRLKAVYTIGILNFVFNESKDDKAYYHSEVKLMDTQKKTVFYDKLTFIYLEMPKFNKSIEQLETRFEKWMYVLKNLPKLQELPSQLQERIFEKIFCVAEIAKMDKKEIAEYEDSLKKYRDLYSALETAKRKGEIKREMEIAQKLLNKSMSIEDVSDATGLSEEQVRELIRKEKT